MTSQPPKESGNSSLGKIALTVLMICTTAIAVFALLAFFHVFGLLFLALVTMFVFQNWARARRNYIRNFNSALQATVQINGSVEQTARAFSTSGPLAHRCALYANQLANGAAPLNAGITCGLPLDINTALAFTLPIRKEERPAQWELQTAQETENKNNLSIASQLLYLVFICIAACACHIFFDILILPTMDELVSEVSTTGEASLLATNSRWIRLTTCLLGLGVITFYITAILGFPSGLVSLSWLPLLPVAAAQKATTLNALANSIEAGCPLKTFCELGMMLPSGSQRIKCAQTINALENGQSETHALAEAGWIHSSELALMEGSTPKRMAEILRNIARQDIRRANSNLNWIMTIMFPASIICLAVSIAPFATTFITELYGLTLSVANSL